MKEPEQTIPNFPSAQTAADLSLSDQDDSRMSPTQRKPLLMNFGKVASRVAIIARDHDAPLASGFFEEQPVTLLYRKRQVSSFDDVVTLWVRIAAENSAGIITSHKRRTDSTGKSPLTPE